MGQDGKDGQDGDADVTDPSFQDEIDEAVGYERKLFYRGLLAVGLVVAVVVIRALFLA
jgi:hypothetical protein